MGLFKKKPKYEDVEDNDENEEERDEDDQEQEEKESKPSQKQNNQRQLSKEEVGDLIEGHISRVVQLWQVYRSM